MCLAQRLVCKAILLEAMGQRIPAPTTTQAGLSFFLINSMSFMLHPESICPLGFLNLSLPENTLEFRNCDSGNEPVGRAKTHFENTLSVRFGAGAEASSTCEPTSSQASHGSSVKTKGSESN